MTEEKIVNFAGYAEISAATIRVLVLDNDKSGIDRAEPWVRMRCKEASRMLDFCAERINALEHFVNELTKVKAITDTPEFGEILDELMTDMEEESAVFHKTTLGAEDT